jgi:hypothetical protein
MKRIKRIYTDKNVYKIIKFFVSVNILSIRVIRVLFLCMTEAPHRR